jgi:YVTN family beta-propeller protein
MPEFDVIDTTSYRVVARLPQASAFSPNLGVSRDGKEVWFTLKDTGKVQIVSGEPPFRILATLDTGPITNHVTLVDNANGKFAYVTVGGLNEVKVYRRGTQPALIATIPTGDLPHGIWHSGNDERVYVGLENSDAVLAIDTLNNKIIATIPIGQTPQALVYVPGAVATGDGTAGLIPLGVAGQAVHIEMLPPAGASSHGRATVAVNSLGLTDLLQIAVAGLQPGQEYQLYLVDSLTKPNASRIVLTKFTANPSGAAVAQAIGPLRIVVGAVDGSVRQQSERRYLVVTVTGSDQPLLQQQMPGRSDP